ncbi:ankyrin repeat domain-containing protein [Candidatus Tisiphia endosymbiont of Dascillus cervinus]|uniref:ankyrin repeat domain-containing protein n=1 Tax=Candidatus Tisiphia endosymbiont of Dascillus cervinus TaxID=3066253 RepID=UPI0039773667
MSKDTSESNNCSVLTVTSTAPQHDIVKMGNIELVRRMLKSPNFNINAKDINGRTPLDLLRNSTSVGDLYIDAVLESVTELEYAAVRGEASPSNLSAQASFERGLLYS